MTKYEIAARCSGKTERMVARAALAAMQGMRVGIHAGTIEAAKDIAKRLRRHGAGDKVQVLITTDSGTFELYQENRT